MRTKLFLLLIFSSLTSLSYSQKLTQEDFQGLWCKVYEPEKNYDSLYNLISEEVIYANPHRESIEKINTQERDTGSINGDPNTLLNEIKILTGGFGAEYSCQELLDVFEINNNTAKFFSNIYYSNVVYTPFEREDLKKMHGHKFLSESEGDAYETIYRLNGDTIFFKKKNSDSWGKNEILYHKNDTLILKNSAQHLLNIYVKMKPDKNISYKIQGITSYYSACLGTCISYTAGISTDGNVNLFYVDSPWEQKKSIKIYDGEDPRIHTDQLDKKKMNELFHILSYFDITKSKKRYCVGMTDSDFRTLTFTLDHGKEIEIKDFHFSGPPILRVVDKIIHKFVIDIVSKK